MEEGFELKNSLERNIADSHREEILASYKEAQQEHSTDKLKFSSDTDELLKMLELFQ